MNTGLLLEMVADAAPERVAVGSRDGGLTTAALLRRARHLAVVLRERGVERLGLVDLNSEAVPLCLFAAGFAGIPFAPVNYRLAPELLQQLVERLAPALVVAGPDHHGLVSGAAGVEVMARDELLVLAAEGDATDGTPDLPFVDTEDDAVHLFTSGTTGDPKVAVLAHRHLTSYILGSVELLAAEEDEAQLVCVPAYHIAGISSVLSSLFSGRRIVYLPAFDPEGWVQVAQAERVTQAMVVPTMLRRILAALEEQGGSLEHLRHLSYGGGRMPLEVIEQAMALLPHVAFVNAYGLTETSSTICVLGPDDHRAAASSDDPVARRRLASVGRPLPTVEVEIRGPAGEPVPTGQSGEIWVRGEQVAGTYQGRRALTDDGWFPTKDQGYLDEEGYLFLEGRIDDVIVRGGENLSPGEIEEVLCEHPGVAEAAVVGLPDPEWGETVGAAVVPVPGSSPSVEELQAWVRERLRSTKTPTVIDVRRELPHNEMGKLLRRVLREELSRTTGAASRP